MRASPNSRHAPTACTQCLAPQVVLAYSGGLDTSIILKWLVDVYGCEVVTFTADLGQVGLGSSGFRTMPTPPQPRHPTPARHLRNPSTRHQPAGLPEKIKRSPRRDDRYPYLLNSVRPSR